MAAWNAGVILCGLLLFALIGEVYLRLTNPFLESSIPFHFVDGVGLIHEPNAKARYAHLRDDSFVVSRANSLGFLDREPVSAERAAAGCHIAFIGDSYVDAVQVHIADKFHVRLEDMAARELPHLDITTQAYGISNTGQINQIPFYDEYARHMTPNVVALVFYINDFSNNSTPLQSLTYGADPDRMPFMSAQRDERGALKLRPPDPEYERFLLPYPPPPWYGNAWGRLTKVSYFAKWLDAKGLRWIQVRARRNNPQIIAAWVNMIAKRPCCASLLDDFQPVTRYDIHLARQFKEEQLLPVYEDALEYTAFGIEQFKLRADRDGAKLIILAATDDMGTRGDPQFDRLSAIAETYGIPVISQYAHIVSQGYDYWDGQLRHDPHWNATGHQWAAEAIMEWLKENQDVCE